MPTGPNLPWNCLCGTNCSRPPQKSYPPNRIPPTIEADACGWVIPVVLSPQVLNSAPRFPDSWAAVGAPAPPRLQTAVLTYASTRSPHGEIWQQKVQLNSSGQEEKPDGGWGRRHSRELIKGCIKPHKRTCRHVHQKSSKMLSGLWGKESQTLGWEL